MDISFSIIDQKMSKINIKFNQKKLDDCKLKNETVCILIKKGHLKIITKNL